MLRFGIFLLYYLSYSIGIAQSDAMLDSLKTGLKTTTSDSLKYVYADELFWQTVYANQDTGFKYGNQAVALAKSMNDLHSQASAQNNLAIYYRMTGQYRLGDSILHDAISLQESIDDTSGLAGSYGNLANIYNAQGEHEKGIEADLQSVRYYEMLGDIEGVGRCYNNIGILHFALKQYEEALAYYQKALSISKDYGDTLSIAQNLSNIGTAEKQLGNTEDALKAYLEANDFIKALGYQRGLAYNLGNIGLLYRDKNDFPKAKDYLNQAAGILEVSNDPKGLARMYDNLAKTALLEEDYSVALDYGNKALELGKDINARPEIRSAYETIHKALAGQGKYGEAYRYQDLFVLLNDSIINEGNTQKIQELEARYEAQTRENQILVQKQTIQTQESDIRLRNFIIVLTMAALALAVLGVFFFRQKQILAKREKELEQQKLQDLQNRQKLIRMDAVIQGEEKERRRIARDLHDGIGSMLAAVKLKVGMLKGSSEKVENTEEAYSLVNDTYEEVRRIAHNMMPKVLLQMGLVPAVRQLTEQISASDKMHIKVEAVNDLPELADYDELILYRVVQELINNIVKHAHATEAWVQFSHFEEELSIMVEDNGVGFDSNARKDGIGMENIRSRIEYLEGELEIDSQEGKGTVITLHIPTQKGEQAKITV